MTWAPGTSGSGPLTTSIICRGANRSSYRENSRHARAHPRESIRRPSPMLDLAIVVPYGTLMSLDELTWIRDAARQQDSGADAASPDPAAAHVAIDAALAAGEDFDVTFDTGPDHRLQARRADF